MNEDTRRDVAEVADLSMSDIEINDLFEVSRAFSSEDVQAFAALSGDYSPLHVDEAYALETEFGQRVVHGMLLASLFSNLIGMRIPGRAALYLGQELTFRAPAFIGETLTARARVTAKSPASSTISLATDIRNDVGRVLVSGNARVKVRSVAPIATLLETTSDAPSARALASSSPTAIVTGGVRGIGGAIARRLSREGYSVIALYRTNEAAARSLVATIEAEGKRARAMQVDITREAEVDASISQIVTEQGPIRLLVNAAVGELIGVPAVELDWQQVAAHLDTQVRGVLRLSQRVHPLMKSAGGGSIVNVLSQVVNNVPPKGMAHYVTAKYALLGLSKALAAEWAADKVRVNMISPGLTRTELTQTYSDRIFRMEAMRTPLGRLVEPRDIAEAVAYLSGSGGEFLTGINLFLSGGLDMP